MRQPELVLDVAAVEHNVRAWRTLLGRRELWAVVKSNAYGLGMQAVAATCLSAGAARLCVIDIDEARVLRDAGIEAPIVHMCATPQAALPDALRLRAIPTIEDASAAQQLSRLASSAGQPTQAHVAIDTGTGWSGVPASKAGALGGQLAGLPAVRFEAAWTHVASRQSLESQMDSFGRAVGSLRAAGLGVPIGHVASTGPVLWGAQGDAARIGIGLYGSTLGERHAELQLKTAFSVRAWVAYVKRFEEETPIGYGGKYVARAGETVATLRIGYAEGLPKSLANAGSVLLGGQRCKIVGDIGMNFTMTAVAPGVRVAVGDAATIVGEEDGVRIDDIAAAAGLIPHALLTSLAAGLRSTFA